MLLLRRLVTEYSIPEEVRIVETHIRIPLFEAMLQPQTIAPCHSCFESLPEATDEEIENLPQPSGQNVAIRIESIEEKKTKCFKISSGLLDPRTYCHTPACRCCSICCY